MLPTPISSQRRSYHRRKSSVSDVWRDRLIALSSRSRVTNLAVLLLNAALLISIATNLHYWLGDTPYTPENPSYGSSILSGVKGCLSSLQSINTVLDRPDKVYGLDHLVMVPGHGVWMGNRPEDIYNESMWALEDYQNGDGAQPRIRAFVAHIRKGIELADSDPKSLLIFSGGATRKSTPLSEATSYLSLATSLSLISATSPVETMERIASEEYALDSFQNLLFSLARFREITGRYPLRITVVGYAMKRARFEQLHRTALRWPIHAWNYVGIDIDDQEHQIEAQRGERTNGYLPYQRDLYGCHDLLLEKRRRRNVHLRAHPYHVSAPEMALLFEWCPGLELTSPTTTTRNNEEFSHVYEGVLPWVNF